MDRCSIVSSFAHNATQCTIVERYAASCTTLIDGYGHSCLMLSNPCSYIEPRDFSHISFGAFCVFKPSSSNLQPKLIFQGQIIRQLSKTGAKHSIVSRGFSRNVYQYQNTSRETKQFKQFGTPVGPEKRQQRNSPAEISAKPNSLTEALNTSYCIRGISHLTTTTPASPVNECSPDAISVPKLTFSGPLLSVPPC